MKRLRQFVRTQSHGGLLALTVAYALAVQAMMASIGFGMSAGAAPDRSGFVLCSFVSHRTAPGPADRQTPVPQCPFCFVAAQSAGHFATGVEVPAVPAYAGSLIVALSRPIGDGVFVRRFRHTHGEPRAPPSASV